MLNKTMAKLTGKDAPLLHFDQGWQYQMPAYRRQLAQRGLTQSMSRKGNCLDNAAMGSFFGTLESEFFYLNRFESIEQLKAEVIHKRGLWKTKAAVELATLEWVSWFNRIRLLESIGDIPPAEAEERYYHQLAAPAAEVVSL